MNKAILMELQEKDEEMPSKINFIEDNEWEEMTTKSCYHRMIDKDYSNLLEAERRHRFNLKQLQ